ncbi:carbohydrate ABC transporter permease [Dactylosporangium matsuzakiense]|uniref:Sugar ABC transporter permease n=1 Tax=Dactylosporangium matsuzakiense TaxID=53360 RepID=A0A9W6KJC9_9ACTN|nr:sugar ABC transporter permease [Dactylosporangium matsuzakiense]UWZ46553.1 sugar ABC transporter permease [Dactylosporangium matsuzakiense]GLL01326.1 sugar ABC transporter permease [Dactylosporangium matsuzakiense]
MTSNVGVAGPRHGRRDPVTPPPRRTSRFGKLDIKYSPYIFVAPFFLLFAVFGAYPLVYTAVLSLRKNTLTGGDQGFVGFENYTKVLTDEHFWTVIGNTFGLFIISTVPQLVLALMIASWLNKKMRARTAIRMGILIPNITSVAAVGIVFGLIFADRYGLANWLLQTVGFDPVEWRNHRWSSWTAIAFMVDWRWTGYNALIYLAAMQAVPKELYESASLDGASAMRRFWRITVPLIQPTILFTVIISTIGGMQLFTEPLLFNYGRVQGGSLNEFQTVAMYIYETTFSNNFNVGRGAAISWLLFLIILIFALINFALVRRSVKGQTR